MLLTGWIRRLGHKYVTGDQNKSSISIEWWLWEADGNGQKREEEVKKSNLVGSHFKVFFKGEWMNWMGNGGEFEIKETYFLRWESFNLFV